MSGVVVAYDALEKESKEREVVIVVIHKYARELRNIEIVDWR